jgi:hypothetical protein
MWSRKPGELVKTTQTTLQLTLFFSRVLQLPLPSIAYCMAVGVLPGVSAVRRDQSLHLILLSILFPLKKRQQTS